MIDIEILKQHVAFGQLGRHRKLGYHTAETADQVILPQPLDGYETISAHAPSDLLIRSPTPMRLAAAANLSFNAPGPVTAIVNHHHIGTLDRPGQRTPSLDLPPGTYRLQLDCPGDNHAAHTLWLVGESSAPVTGRLALVTVAAYPPDSIQQRCRTLFATAASRGLPVHVDQYGGQFWNLFTCKIEKNRDFIAALPACYSHVLFLDAEDTLVIGGEQEIIAALDCLTISTEDCSWPVESEDWKEHFPVGPHRFPNSGCYGGPRHELLAALDDLIALHYELKQGQGPQWAHRHDNAWTNPYMDQFLWQIALRWGRFPCRLDNAWKLCACLTCTHLPLTPTPHYTIRDRRLITAAGTTPPVIHLPGPGKPYLNAWQALLT